jgi:hypothetical protein
VAIANVEEHEGTEIAQPVHPSEQHDLLAGRILSELAAGMSAREAFERLNVHR